MKQLLSILFLIISLNVFGQTKISAPLVRNNSADTLYGTHIDSLGYGGYVTFDNISTRNAFPMPQRKYLMQVAVKSTDSVYILSGGLTNQYWVPLFKVSEGIIPNLQNVILKGSNLTQDNTIDGGGYELDFNNFNTIDLEGTNGSNEFFQLKGGDGGTPVILQSITSVNDNFIYLNNNSLEIGTFLHSGGGIPARMTFYNDSIQIGLNTPGPNNNYVQIGTDSTNNPINFTYQDTHLVLHRSNFGAISTAIVGDYLQVTNGKIGLGNSVAGTTNPTINLGNNLSLGIIRNTSLNNQGANGATYSQTTVTNYDNPGGINLNSIRSSNNSILILPVQSATSNVVHQFTVNGANGSELRLSNFNNALSNPLFREETNARIGGNVALVRIIDWDTLSTGNNWTIAAKLPSYNAQYQPPNNGTDSFHVFYTLGTVTGGSSLFEEKHAVGFDFPDLKASFHICDTCDVIWIHGKGDREVHDDSTILLNNISTSGVATKILGLDANNRIVSTTTSGLTPSLQSVVAVGNTTNIGINLVPVLSAVTVPPTGITEYDTSGRLTVRTATQKTYAISTAAMATLTNLIDTLPPVGGRFIVTSDTNSHAPTYINSVLNNGDYTHYRYIYALATSLTLGVTTNRVTTNNDSIYLEYLFRNYGVVIINRGLAGRTTQQNGTDSSLFAVKTTIPYYSTLPAGSILLLEGMVNDAIHDTTVYLSSTYQTQLTVIVDTAIAHGWPAGNILLYNPTYWSQNTASKAGNIPYRHSIYSAAQAAVAANRGTLVYDAYSDWYAQYNLNNSLLNSDSLHPTDAGQRVAGQLLVTYLSGTSVPSYNYTNYGFNGYSSMNIIGNSNIGNNENIGGTAFDNYLNVTRSAIINGTSTFFSSPFFQNGSFSSGAVLGANSNATTLTVNTNKRGSLQWYRYRDSINASPFFTYNNTVASSLIILGAQGTNNNGATELDLDLSTDTGANSILVEQITGAGNTFKKQITRSGNFSAAAWGTAGVAQNYAAATYTDSTTAAGATISNAKIYTFGIPTITALNATAGSPVVYTNPSTVYIAGAPSFGANTSGTTPIALEVASGNVKISTITSGTWQGTAVASGFGGTGFTNYTKGDIISATATNTLSKLSIGTTKQKLGVVSGVATWMDTLAITQGSGITVTAGVVAASGLTGSNFSNAAANTVFGNNTGSSTAPSFQTSLNLSGSGTFATGISLGLTGKISITEGTNASVGQATLSGGTVTVSTTAVTANSRIFLTDATTGSLTNIGTPTVGTIVAGTSFVINSTNVLDASKVNWLIIN